MVIIYFPLGPENMHEKIKEANATLAKEAKSAPFKTIAWYGATDSKKNLKATNSDIGKAINNFTNKPHKWSNNPLEAFFLSSKAEEEKKTHEVLIKEKEAHEVAATAENIAKLSEFKDSSLNTAAVEAIDKWRKAHLAASTAKSKAKVKAYNQIPYLFGLMIVIALFSVSEDML